MTSSKAQRWRHHLPHNTSSWPLLVLVPCWSNDTTTGNRKVGLWFPTMQVNVMRGEKKNNNQMTPPLRDSFLPSTHSRKTGTFHLEHSDKNERMTWACSFQFLTQQKFKPVLGVGTRGGNVQGVQPHTKRNTLLNQRRNTTSGTRLFS